MRRSKQRAASRKLFSLPPKPLPPSPHQMKYTASMEQNFSYGDIKKYTDICFNGVPRMYFLVSRNGAVQMFFLTPNRNMFAGKFVKSDRLLAVLREHIIFNIKWVEVHKMKEVYWAEPHCKMSDLFR